MVRDAWCCGDLCCESAMEIPAVLPFVGMKSRLRGVGQA